ncbi:MAG: GDSL-type esterase/lipase family protein [Oscillospiraceae bacterium]|nr:GDSL-type esterase/lipase family protein [Oscillospiraceae bacterium]
MPRRREKTRNLNRERIFVALLKASIPVILSACIYYVAYSVVSREVENLSGERVIYATPAKAAKPTPVPREFTEPVKKETNVRAVVLESSEPVGEEYFADAVFAGDSLTDGFRIYDVGQHFEVISYVGLSPGTAITQPVYRTAEGEMLILADAINYMGARKAYIMLGTNGLEWMSPEKLISGYSDLVDQLMATNPDTYIILESIPPVTAATAASRTSYNRERVGHYNNLIKELATEKGIYFLDVYSAFAGDDGYLPTNIAAGDGIHMFPSGYRIWFEYITTHTIKGSAAFVMDGEGRIIPTQPVEPPQEEEPEEEEPD